MLNINEVQPFYGCNNCGNPKIEAFGLCASCAAQARKEARMNSKPKKVYRIPRMSPKRTIEAKDYEIKKRAFLKGKVCPVHPALKCEDVHHQKGRIGFADQWARDNGVTLLMDERFWLACSRKGHIKIERFPKWARENGYSLPRNELEKDFY